MEKSDGKRKTKKGKTNEKMEKKGKTVKMKKNENMKITWKSGSFFFKKKKRKIKKKNDEEGNRSLLSAIAEVTVQQVQGVSSNSHM